jgi:hypothetical protein
LCCVSFVIRTPVSKKKKEFKKKVREKKFREKKRERTEKVEEEERGCTAVCSLKTIYMFRFLVIYIPATLYHLSTSNHLIFSTVASLV